MANPMQITRFVLGWTTIWGPFGEIVNITGSIMLVWGLLYYMYKKGIFLRV
jgi:hypothetical protein